MWPRLLLLAFALSGCGAGGAPPNDPISCTLIGCSDGVSIEIVAAGGAVPPGQYVVTVDSGGTQREHRCRLPSSGGTVSCSTTPLIFFADGKMSIEVAGIPTILTVTVAVDGTTRATQELRPAYTAHRPNGPECEPVCQRALATVTLQ
jgi:hypothetical protein